MVQAIKKFGLVIFSLVSITVFSQPFTELQKLDASDRQPGDRFGSVAISGNYAIVGAGSEDHDVNGLNTLSNSGAAYIFEKQMNGSWLQVQKIVAGDREMGSNFGAYVDISGNYAIVGATYESKDANGINPISPYAGAAYIFERQPGGNWIQKQKLVANDRKASQDFGIRVAINGTRAVISASAERYDASNLNPITGAGAAYVFELVGPTWTQVAKLVAPDRANGSDPTYGNRFGCSVELDGNYMIVGSRYDNKNVGGTATASTRAGSAYIYERIAGVWTYKQKIVAPDRAIGDEFGEAVNIDDTTIIIGSIDNSLDATGSNYMSSAGAAYIFERNNTTTNWNYKTKLVAPDRSTDAQFGDEITIDGDYMLVGAWYDSYDENFMNPIMDAGSAYIYEKNHTTGNWGLFKKIDATDRGTDDLFSSTIGISGSNIIIGAFIDDEDETGGDPMVDAGSAYIFGTAGPILCETYDTLTLTVCDSLVGPSGSYTWYSSGTYNDTILNAALCDSIITFYLTVNQSSSAIINVTACDSLVSPSGSYTWYASGTYYDTISNNVGCDSAIRVNLTLYNSVSSSVIVTACDSLVSPSGRYTWYGSGSYRDTLTTSNGCDSILLITLTIINSSTSTLNVVACDSMVSPSTNYTWYVSGTYYDTLVNVAGCDSIIRVNLIIHYTNSSIVNIATCDSLVSPSGLYTYYTSGVYNDTLTNANGCDSIITLNVTITTQIQIAYKDTLCDSLLSPSGTKWWYTSGVHYDTIFNPSGCDTVYVIDLTEYCDMKFIIPQFYSPNGDGINDKWVIPNIDQFPNNVKIFNRWGSVVFQMDNYDNSWGGETNKGLSVSSDDGTLPSGTYFYIVEVEMAEKESFTGYVVLRK